MLEDLGSDVAYKAQIEIGTLAQTFKVNVDMSPCQKVVSR